MQDQEKVTMQEIQREIQLEELTRCCLCGHYLVFSHRTDYLTLQVEEKAECPACKIQLRTQQHALQ